MTGTRTLSQACGQFSGERKIAKRAAFDLEAGGDNDSTRLAHQSIHGQKRPLMESTAG